MYRAERRSPASLKVKELMAERRQFPSDTCRVPETEEEVEKANRLTKKLCQLLQDDDFVRVRNIFIFVADILVGGGEITDEQYLSIHEMYHNEALNEYTSLNKTNTI